jgi:hypothetical protein
MTELPEEPKKNPLNQVRKPSTGVDGSPKFGRLLIVLVLTVILLGLLTWATEAYYA